jgi:methylated-DNA-protein-cysteine methyltransferase-like protein
VTSDSYALIYEAVRQIPEGRVATYGQIAAVAGLGRHARLVGYALNACEDDLPWHRVINARGEISGRTDPFYETLQRERLESEGVSFDKRGRVSMARYQWQTDAPLEDPDW